MPFLKIGVFMTRKQSENVAQKIKIFMMKNGISQRELAKKMKVAPQTVSQFLGGKYDLRMETIEKISKALGAPVNYFFDNSTDVKGNHNVVGKNISVSSDVKKDIVLLSTQIELLSAKIKIIETEVERLKTTNRGRK